MGKPRSWFGIVQNKFFRPPPQNTVIVLHANNTISTSFIEENRNRIDDAANEMSKKTDVGSNRIPLSCSSTEVKELSEEDTAAIKIQAFFRGHLARRAFRALKGLVKLQAVVRGVRARRQSQIALHCMHVLARLRITVHSRRLLGRSRMNQLGS
ncbi:hypothetical protein RHMOL_Rhmol08G0035800 [Rhododendron molle]|uniref:Uncharacterized protein n=1 Tax=Rhododendron molle TaxID=49168 RepID=A0ACC0MJB8_RHOML|nr:hypothetical protein RHMOL_Rhmol08G0035800 [Rhododendron molle]